VRMIHACGMVDLVEDIAFSEQCVAQARAVLTQGRPIFVDAHMVEKGIIHRTLEKAVANTGSAPSALYCHLQDPRLPDLAQSLGTTRSAAQVTLWQPDLEGALVVIGNAPTALFHLLEMISAGGPKPAAVFGLPVGFVGAAESKEALKDHAAALDIDYLTVRGRRGGSAMAAAAVNALFMASDAQAFRETAAETAIA